MLVEPRDLVEALSADDVGGGPFERFVRDLIRAEAAIEGIPETDIDWDYRTNCKDGGCDIFVKKGASGTRLLPNTPSIWSIKGGDDGTAVATFRTEVVDHPRIQNHMKTGNSYVWCALQPVTQIRRDNFYKEMEGLATSYGFDKTRVLFVWQDHLAGRAEFHPNLIVGHLPRVAQRLQGVLSLQQWSRTNPERVPYQTPWVNVEHRDDIKMRVQQHFKDTSGSAVLHVAGLSGIGKTRTVVQGCLDDSSLQSVLYAPRRQEMHPALLNHLDDERSCCKLIIDEVSLSEYQVLAARYSEAATRVRIVTVGPTRASENSNSAGVLLLRPFSSTDSVLTILQQTSRCGVVAESVLRSIASLCAPDVRLALAVLEATCNTPAQINLPVTDLDDVLSRILAFHARAVGQADVFRERFRVVTGAIDVGWADDVRAEIEYLASIVGKPVAELDQVVDHAKDIGLGLKTRKFFEATPRALAVHVFRWHFWPLIEGRIGQFLANMPTERLRRRFLDRCQEVPEAVRGEVMDRVSGFFRQSLSSISIVDLADREKSRVFQAWAEFDPERGLAWLQYAVEHASDEELRALDGNPDGSGGWRGRRQLVWLCENLACFPDHFHTCERVLFRMAQVETEPSIGNNSTATWKCLFLPVLSHSSIPFTDRFKLLLDRLGQTDVSRLPLVLDAGFQTLDTGLSRITPPLEVGGRLVPPEWQPRTLGELGQLRQTAGKLLLQTIGQLPSERRSLAIDCLLAHFRLVVLRNLVADARPILPLTALSPDQLRKLRAELDDKISLNGDIERRTGKPHFPNVRELEDWRQALEPDGLMEEVLDVTARDCWAVSRKGRRDGDDEDAVFKELAGRLLNEPAVWEELRQWFYSPKCLSGGTLGCQLGTMDRSLRCLPMVLDWLSSAGHCEFCGKYLAGVFFSRGRTCHPTVHDWLERMASQNPVMAVQITLEADITCHGFSRLRRCFPLLSDKEVAWYWSLGRSPWEDILSPIDRAETLRFLAGRPPAEDGSAIGCAVALHILHLWYGDSPMPPEIVHVSLEVWRTTCHRPINGNLLYEWEWLGESLVQHFPAEVATLAADVMTDVQNQEYGKRQSAEKVILAVARAAPQEAMSAIGTQLLDEERQSVFRLFEFEGVFDAIGLAAVREFVERHGAGVAAAIARHLNGPHLDEFGTPVIPEVTNWILTQFGHVEDVFAEFCMGQHSGKVVVGWAKDRKPEIERKLAAFRTIPQPWVQRWVEHEQRHIAYEVKREDDLLDERNRR